MVLNMGASQSFVPAFGVRLQYIKATFLSFGLFDFDFLTDGYKLFIKFALFDIVDLPINE